MVKVVSDSKPSIGHPTEVIGHAVLPLMGFFFCCLIFFWF
jgi:hypothetical protein